MFNIRKGVFETNSSSVHSLVIKKDDWYSDSTDDKEYIVTGGYYGRSPHIPLETTQEKLDYIWTMVDGLFGKQCVDWKNRVYDYIDKERWEKWKQMITKICPNAKLIEPEIDNWDIGIDHVQELDKFADAVEKDPRILRYLLLSYSWIDVTGDEYANWPGILPYPYYELTNINDWTLLYIKGN